MQSMVLSALSRFAARRQGRRILTVLLWASFAGVIVLHTLAARTVVVEIALGVLMLLAFASYVVLTRALNLHCGPLDRPLDERERAERDAAHYTAFRVGNWCMTLVMVYVILALNLGGTWLPSTPRQAASALLAVGIAFGLLPVTLLAWNSAGLHGDDVDHYEVPALSFRTGVSAWRRRVMFGLAVCAAGAAGLGAAGVVPALAPKVGLFIGMAMGLGLGAVVLTRTVKGTRS
jgi:hypothetical protein